MLNDILTSELTKVNQYFVHAEMCRNWGYERLYKKIRAESIREMKHAEKIVEHILYLEGVPNMQRLGDVLVGETVPEQLKLDLKKEQDSAVSLNKAIAKCTAVGDNNTRHKLEEMLEEAEEQVDWLETQLEAIRQVGLENYLSEQLKKEES
ncbi:MAG: bacterioferritin [Deltaproteobacteria bacterium]|nr:bacterioferritin [Deltaproteobacteria bacterium]MCL4873662.1 bacterioferritin [bacterium]